MQIYGAVVVAGREYYNNDILDLVFVPFVEWNVAGDLDKTEGDICVVFDDHRVVFSGENFLHEAVGFLATQVVLH